MTQPATYDPATNFASDESGGVSGRGTVRTAQLDAELANISVSVNQIIANLETIQRDDTALRDGVVGLEALSTVVSAFLTAAGGSIKGAWLTATLYAIKDVVAQGTATYICAVSHTSGVFATDLAANRWVRIFDSAAYSAANISFSPTGTIVSTTVQAAIAELDTDLTAERAIKRVLRIDTVTALKALTAPAGDDTYCVLGFALKGDGGGGLYWWDAGSSETDDGGMVLQLNIGGVGRFKKLF